MARVLGTSAPMVILDHVDRNNRDVSVRFARLEALNSRGNSE
jgi:hypothetical protein